MHRFARFFILVGILLFAAGAADAQIDARMLRQPDVSATEVAFVYGGDIWVVSKEGGVAHRLSTPAGEESFPRFSPDGQQMAFTGNYDGNQDIFVMPTSGGLPTRVTHHPDPAAYTTTSATLVTDAITRPTSTPQTRTGDAPT